MRGTRVRVALAVLLVAAVAIPLAVISLASAGDEHSLTAVAKAATARFHDLDAAKAAGWNVVVKDKLGIICIDNQPVAAPRDRIDGEELAVAGEQERPEALVFAPNAAGQPKFAALEYIVFADVWTKAGHTGPPSLFGEQFLLTPDGNRFGIPAFWALHVWIWHPNPAGMFQPWNPRVHC